MNTKVTFGSFSKAAVSHPSFSPLILYQISCVWSPSCIEYLFMYSKEWIYHVAIWQWIKLEFKSKTIFIAINQISYNIVVNLTEVLYIYFWHTSDTIIDTTQTVFLRFWALFNDIPGTKKEALKVLVNHIFNAFTGFYGLSLYSLKLMLN